jgi:hypothetical protein
MLPSTPAGVGRPVLIEGQNRRQKTRHRHQPERRFAFLPLAWIGTELHRGDYLETTVTDIASSRTKTDCAGQTAGHGLRPAFSELRERERERKTETLSSVVVSRLSDTRRDRETRQTRRAIVALVLFPVARSCVRYQTSPPWCNLILVSQFSSCCHLSILPPFRALRHLCHLQIYVAATTLGTAAQASSRQSKHWLGRRAAVARAAFAPTSPYAAVVGQRHLQPGPDGN